MGDRLSFEFVPTAIGDVGFGGSCFLLCAPPKKVTGAELRAVRTRDSHGHVPILVIHDVSGGVPTERVADPALDAFGFPRYEFPGADERIIRCQSLFLQEQCLRFSAI